MKIGIDARLSKQTGVGRYIRNLYENLEKIDKNNKYEYDLIQAQIGWHSLAEQLIFPFWLFFKNYDLVHFTYFSLPIFYPGKFVLTIHDLIPWHFATGKASRLPRPIYYLKSFFYRWVLWVGARRAKHIMAVSETTKQEIIDHLKIDPKKIKVIYEGVNKNFQFSIFNFQKIKPYFLYVGNAYPHKNLESLIEAFREIKDYKLVLVGPEDYFYKKLRERVKRGKRDKKDGDEEKIIFYGRVDDKELVALYCQAKAFINPSLMEGFGLPGLEAMNAGCPVICADIPAFREIYGEAAIYFKVRGIGETVKQFLAMPEEERKRLVLAGKKQAEKYSWEKCARQTLEVYESCLGL